MDTRDVRYFGKPDWADDYYQSSLLYNVNASIGGGSKKANYVFTLATTKDAGAADNTSYTKYNIGFALNMVPLDGLNVSLLRWSIWLIFQLRLHLPAICIMTF